MTFYIVRKASIFPEKWKNDRRTPIHKKGKKSNCETDRLFHKHLVFRKVFSTVIERRRSEWLPTRKHMLTQYRCCPEPPEAPIAETIIRSLRSCGGLIPTLIRKLSNYGVKGTIPRVIANIYTGVHARLSVNGALSRSVQKQTA